MTITTPFFRSLILLAMLTLGLFTTLVRAQNDQQQDTIYVDTELSRSSVYVGDELSFSVSIYNARNPETPQIEFPPGVRAVYHGRSSQSFTSMRNDNGRRRTVTQRSFVFQYTLTALEEGPVTIPAPIVVDAGVSFTGDQERFNSLLPTQSADDVLEITMSRSTLYLNETIEVECSWWLNNRTSEFNFTSSLFPPSFELRPIAPPRSAANVFDFPLNGQSLRGYVSDGVRNGEALRKFTFKFTLTPTELGTFDLGPLRSVFTRQSGTGSRFRAYVESEPLTIEVLPVPTQGKPSNYEGAMGSFALDARASNQRVHVGDPIELMLRIQGQEPMTGVQNAPSLELIPEFTNGFKLDSAGWREDMPRRDGVRIYRTTLRALSDAVKRIPPITLPAFDPELGTYRTYATKPIDLQVTAVKEITLADAIVTGDQETQLTPRRPEVERIELTTAAPGLWVHASAEELGSNRHFDVLKTLQTPAWIAGITSPPATYLALVFAMRYRRNRNMDIVKAKQAFSASKRVRGTDALKVYLSQILDIELEALTGADADRLNASRELRATAQECLMASESDRSATHAIDTKELIRSIHAEHVESIKEAAS